MESQSLWAPWRMPYLLQLDADARDSSERSTTAQQRPTDSPACFLCDAAAAQPGSDAAAQRLVLINDARGVILLNKFPYANGHLLVAVGEHLPGLAELSVEQRSGLMELVTLGETLLRTAVNPQGVNIGINLGRCAGAGLPGHLHVHIVPRWAGDTNFMQTVGQVRVIPQALEQSYEHLRRVLAAMGKQ